MSEFLPDFVPPERAERSTIAELADGGWARLDGELLALTVEGRKVYRWMLDWQADGKSVRGSIGPRPPSSPA